MRGEALQSFYSNRIGLCVLHPLAESYGREVIITTPDGHQYTAVFPDTIHPQPVFTDIRRMQWNSGDTSISMLLEGDVFETEDQRNWSDGSFKTYSTPSSLPKPVQVTPGDSIAQQIIIHVAGGNNKNGEKRRTSAGEKRPFPLIGYGRPLANHSTLPALLPLLQKIPLHHYRVLLQLQQPDWRAVLSAAAAEAVLLQTKLALVVQLPLVYENEFNQLLNLLTPIAQRLYSLLLLQDGQPVTPPQLIHTLHPILKKQLPALLLGYGTEGAFADFNSQRPENMMFDFVSFSLHPQVHATDERSILDNVDSHADLLHTARLLTNGKAVHVSPITFGEKQADPDVRQYGSLLAWWTIKSLQQLAGAASVTYFELFGSKGLLTVAKQTANNNEVRCSVLYDVLVAIRQFEPVFIITETMDEAAEESLLLENAAGKRLKILPPSSLQWQSRSGVE